MFSFLALVKKYYFNNTKIYVILIIFQNESFYNSYFKKMFKNFFAYLALNKPFLNKNIKKFAINLELIIKKQQ